VDGVLKVTGQATFTASVRVPGCLSGAILRSPLPHARIKRINAGQARELPGVHAVLTGADVGGALYGRAIADVPVLCTDRVRFVGDPVAAVAADDAETAELALKLIEVEYDELPAVFDPFQAMTPDAPRLHPEFASYRRDLRQPDWPDEPLPDVPNLCSYRLTSSGDPERGFGEADLVFERTYRTPVQHQGYIEPHSCIVSAEPGGSMRVWASTKSPFVLRGLLGRDLGLDPERIVVEPVYVGGDFGGKGSPMHVPLTYFLSRASGRPVRLVLPYGEDMQAGDPRHPAWVTIRTGINRDGAIVARTVRAVFASGAYAGFKPIANAELAGGHYVHGTYRIPNHAYESLIAYTNTVPCGHMRAPGGLQTVFACEVEMDRLARAIGMDPIDLRLKNGVQAGDMGVEGQPWASVRLPECLAAVRSASGWDQPRPPGVGRGIALCQSPIGPGASTARVSRGTDGGVTLETSVFEQGSGSHTILSQIVAEELAISPDGVHVQAAGTDVGLWDRGSSASAVTHGAGQAARLAARELREQLRSPTAAGEGSMVAEARYEDWHPPSTTSFVAQVVEVEIDGETGQVRVRKVTGAYDVGTILNTIGVTGQIEGGLLMGLGAAAMEELRIVDGRVETAGLHEYKLPTMRDIPEHRLIPITDDAGPGPYGAKQTSELSNLPFAAAYANAVHDATGIELDELPVTAERIFRALAAQS
jgi:CO/xanthine dehydrogenase Mo-binding subunit